MEWRIILDTLGPNLYMISRQESRDRTVSRILITKSNYQQTLPPVSTTDNGSPIFANGGRIYHAARCHGTGSDHWFPHEIKFAIECDDREGEWLYNMSHILANDHFCVNIPLVGSKLRRKDGRPQRYKLNKCYKFNTSHNTLCPYQFLRDQVVGKLSTKCPDIMFKDLEEVLDTKPNSSDVENSNDFVSVLSNFSSHFSISDKNGKFRQSSQNGTNLQSLDELLLKNKFEDIDSDRMTCNLMDEKFDRKQRPDMGISDLESEGSLDPSNKCDVDGKTLVAGIDIDEEVDKFLANSLKNSSNGMNFTPKDASCVHCNCKNSNLSREYKKTNSNKMEITSKVFSFDKSEQTCDKVTLNNGRKIVRNKPSKPARLTGIHRSNSEMCLAKFGHLSINTKPETDKVYSTGKIHIPRNHPPSRTLYRATYASSMKVKPRGMEEVQKMGGLADAPVRDVPDRSYYRLTAYPTLI